MRFKTFQMVVANAVILIVLVGFGVLTLRGGAVAVSTDHDNVIYYRGNVDRPNIALMINVYWGDEYLDTMLDILQDKDVKCTFFLGGSWVKDREGTLKRLVEHGHELGNHGYNHKSPTTISDERNREEILVTERLIESMVGVRTTLFAPPSGDVNQNVARIANEMGYRTIMWSQDTIDWRDQDVEVIVRRATAKAANGNLVLMHPTKATALALPKIIDRLRELGYNLTTVSQTLA